MTMTHIVTLTVVSVHDFCSLWLKGTLLFSMAKLVGGFKCFLFSPRSLGKVIQSDLQISFNWIETGQPPPSKRMGDRCVPIQMHGFQGFFLEKNLWGAFFRWKIDCLLSFRDFVRPEQMRDPKPPLGPKNPGKLIQCNWCLETPCRKILDTMVFSGKKGNKGYKKMTFQEKRYKAKMQNIWHILLCG